MFRRLENVVFENFLKISNRKLRMEHKIEHNQNHNRYPGYVSEQFGWSVQAIMDHKLWSIIYGHPTKPKPKTIWWKFILFKISNNQSSGQSHFIKIQSFLTDMQPVHIFCLGWFLRTLSSKKDSELVAGSVNKSVMVVNFSS